MNLFQSTGIAPIVRKAFVRFSLFLLLLFVTTLCVALAWWFRPNYVVAESLFHIGRRPPTMFGETPFNEREYELFQKSQLALVKSNFVLAAAARQLSTRTLPAFQSPPATVDWLSQHLEVEFPENSEILAIRLRGAEEHSQDLIQIVDAVARAYEEEVVHKDRTHRLRTREVKSAYERELRNNIEQLMFNESELSTESSEDKVQIELNKLELGNLLEFWRDLRRSLEIDELNMEAPDQIMLVQPAAIRPE